MEFDRNEAVQIVGFDLKNSKATLDDTILAKIINRYEKIRDMPTIVISIGGVARSGKSFLLNLFVSYLSYIEVNGSGKGWEVSGSPVEGVNWAQSKTAVTLGIWMWNRPYIITRSDGSKAVVLLIDSQGTGDNQHSDQELDTLIMYISLQISSVQVLNIKQYLTSNEMTSLQLCADYAEVGESEPSVEGEDDYLFNSLIFAIRDYQSGPELGEGPNIFLDIVQNVNNDKLKNVVLGIVKAFRSITTYTFPHPGHKLAFASETNHNLKVKDVPTEFLEVTRDLIQKLCGQKTIDRDQRCWSSARELFVNFQMLKDHLENDNLPQITNPAEALQETVLYRAYVAAQKEFAQGILNFSSSTQWVTKFPTELALRKAFDVEVSNAYAKFNRVGNQRKYSESFIWKKYQGMLSELFEKTYSGIKTQYEFHGKFKQLEEDYAVLNHQMIQQKSQFDQQLEKVNREVAEAKLQQAEIAQISTAVVESLNTEFQKLQFQVVAEDAEAKAENERRLEEYRREAQGIKDQAERDKQKQARELEALMEKVQDYQVTREIELARLNEQKKEMEAKMAEERVRGRGEEEETTAGFDAKTALFEVLVGAAIGGMTGGTPGAAAGALQGVARQLGKRQK